MDEGADTPRGVCLTLAYDGTHFAGFQCQPNARTVQGVLDAAIYEIVRHPVKTRGAGRTDAGVHAQGQVAAFTTTRALSPRRWVLAVNRYLPEEIAVQDAAPCAPDYDPRWDAMDKTYRYLFYTGFARNPLYRTRAWHLGRDAHVTDADTDLTAARGGLDLGAMRDACARLTGTHDFGAFRAADDRRENAVRTLHRVELTRGHEGEPRLLALTVTGTAFMKNMVRILAGTLIAVGRYRLSPDDVSRLLLPGARRCPQSATAPAHGLTLLHVTLGRQRGSTTSPPKVSGA